MAATVVPSAIVNLKVLSQDNYKEWSFRVKTYLLAEDLWKVVDVTNKPPKEGQANFNAWSKDNAKALHTIHISCGDNAYSFIEDISLAKYAWEILAKQFNPTEISHKAGITMPKFEGENIMNEEFMDYLKKRNWKDVMEFIKLHREAVRARKPSNGATALDFAVYAANVEIVKELVELMRVEDLEIRNKINNTALGSAILQKDTCNMIEIIKCLVRKNNKLLTIVGSGDNIPLVGAFKLQKWEMAAYIYSVTQNETLDDKDAAELISLGIVHERLDIPLDLIRYKSSLGITEDHFGTSPLFQLADTTTAFLSGSRLRFWEQWIYQCIHVKPTRAMDFKKDVATNINDVCIDVQRRERSQANQRHLICSVGHFFRGLVKNLHAIGHLFRGLVGINRIYQMKLTHALALEILDHIIKVLKNEVVDDNFVPAIFRAAQLGQVEFITQIYQEIPRSKYILDVDGKNMYQFSAECRQEQTYNLIYRLDEQKQKYFVDMRDKYGNNILHIIGLFSSFAKIYHIRGAALQMQRELQWFKEVDSIVSPHTRETINNIDRIKPFELFTKNHVDLVKEGEKSMKETATSCTVVGALIVTIMFAAAFTVPGGNGNTGFPKFLDQKEFKIFIASDAISLFFSTTSVMIFLGMLTSRYAQDDFLTSLPTKMILGLLTLFISIASMMVAFSSALFLMVPGELWIAFPAMLLSTIPIASFVWMQFPLLADIIIYTYGAGVFDRKVQP